MKVSAFMITLSLGLTLDAPTELTRISINFGNVQRQSHLIIENLTTGLNCWAVDWVIQARYAISIKPSDPAMTGKLCRQALMTVQRVVQGRRMI